MRPLTTANGIHGIALSQMKGLELKTFFFFADQLRRIQPLRKQSSHFRRYRTARFVPIRGVLLSLILIARSDITLTTAIAGEGRSFVA
jgi:hypothetical protein